MAHTHACTTHLLDLPSELTQGILAHFSMRDLLRWEATSRTCLRLSRDMPEGEKMWEALLRAAWPVEANPLLTLGKSSRELYRAFKTAAGEDLEDFAYCDLPDDGAPVDPDGPVFLIALYTDGKRRSGFAGFAAWDGVNADGKNYNAASPPSWPRTYAWVPPADSHIILSGEPKDAAQALRMACYSIDVRSLRIVSLFVGAAEDVEEFDRDRDEPTETSKARELYSYAHGTSWPFFAILDEDVDLDNVDPGLWMDACLGRNKLDLLPSTDEVAIIEFTGGIRLRPVAGPANGKDRTYRLHELAVKTGVTEYQAQYDAGQCQSILLAQMTAARSNPRGFPDDYSVSDMAADMVAASTCLF